MNIAGFVYVTGTLYCDTSVTERGDYKRIAYVWENGVIDWYVPSDTVDSEGRKAILACSRRYEDAVQKKCEEYNTNKALYSYLLDKEDKGLTLKEFNMKRWLVKVAQEIEDLLNYRTTAVIHY